MSFHKELPHCQQIRACWSTESPWPRSHFLFLRTDQGRFIRCQGTLKFQQITQDVSWPWDRQICRLKGFLKLVIQCDISGEKTLTQMTIRLCLGDCRPCSREAPQILLVFLFSAFVRDLNLTQTGEDWSWICRQWWEEGRRREELGRVQDGWTGSRIICGE